MIVNVGVTRNSEGDEIADVIVHVKQNTIDSYIDSDTNRRGCVGTHVNQIQ